SFSKLLKRVKNVCLGAYAHQDVPFEKLVEELQPERDLGRSPLFQVKLTLQNAPQDGLWMEGIRLVGEGGNQTQTAKFDLTVDITDAGQELVGMVEYSLDLFEEGTIRRLTHHYTNVLKAIAADSEKPISHLSLLSEAEKEQIVVEWNETWRSYPNDLCIHELFAEQSNMTPQQIALIDDNQQVSYRELNRRANQ